MPTVLLDSPLPDDHAIITRKWKMACYARLKPIFFARFVTTSVHLGRLEFP